MKYRSDPFRAEYLSDRRHYIHLLRNATYENEVSYMEYVAFITWIFLVLVVIYYLHVRLTIKTWEKKRLLRKEETSLKEGVERYQKAVNSLKSSPYIGVFMVIIMVVGVRLAFPQPDAWITFVVLLIPLPVIAYLFYKSFALMLERSQELYKKEQM